MTRLARCKGKFTRQNGKKVPDLREGHIRQPMLVVVYGCEPSTAPGSWDNTEMKSNKKGWEWQEYLSQSDKVLVKPDKVATPPMDIFSPLRTSLS